MARLGVKENCKYLGETWGGYFANDLSAQDIAEKVMQERFKEYSEEYKDSTVKTEVSENSCRLDLGDGDFIEVSIEDLDGPYQVQFSDYEGETYDGGVYDTFEDAKEAAVDGYHTDQDYNYFVIYNKDGDIVYDESDLSEDEQK